MINAKKKNNNKKNESFADRHKKSNSFNKTGIAFFNVLVASFLIRSCILLIVALSLLMLTNQI